jgi:hypothetical protein
MPFKGGAAEGVKRFEPTVHFYTLSDKSSMHTYIRVQCG